MVRLLICGGAAGSRSRLSTRVQTMADVAAVEVAATVDDALSILAVHNPDLILLDARVSGSGAAAVIRSVATRRPRPVVLMLGGAEDADVIAEALVAGARGVLHRDFSHEELAATVAHVHSSQRATASAGRMATAVGQAAPVAERTLAAVGARSVSTLEAPSATVTQLPVPSHRVVPAVAPAGPALTEREQQVLRGMSEGKSNAEIGRGLFLSEDTVKTHAQRPFRKLGVNDRAHAVAAGFRIGLVV